MAPYRFLVGSLVIRNRWFGFREVEDKGRSQCSLRVECGDFGLKMLPTSQFNAQLMLTTHKGNPEKEIVVRERNSVPLKAQACSLVV
jgi:hypothetical protein